MPVRHGCYCTYPSIFVFFSTAPQPVAELRPRSCPDSFQKSLSMPRPFAFSSFSLHAKMQPPVSMSRSPCFFPLLLCGPSENSPIHELGLEKYSRKKVWFYARISRIMYLKLVFLSRQIPGTNFWEVFRKDKYQSLSIKPCIGKDSAHDERI
jgi:hypothetical protein